MTEDKIFIEQTKKFREYTGLPNDSSVKVLKASAKCVVEELSELADAMGDSIVTLAGIANQCTDKDIYRFCYDKISDIHRSSLSLGIDISIVTAKIYDANLSKVCDNLDVAAATKQKYEDNGIETYIKPVLDKYAVYSSKDQEVSGKPYPKDKLLKSVDWKEPDYSNLNEWLFDFELKKLLTENLE